MKKRTKNNIKKAGGIWVRVLSSAVLCLFMYFSMFMVINMFVRTEVGYNVVMAADETQIVDTHYYTLEEDPADTDKLELPEDQKIVRIYTDLTTSSTGSTIFKVAMSAVMLITVGVFPYNVMWKLGSADLNKVRYGRKKKDLLRGLKIGLLATTPSYLLYLLLIPAKLQLIFPQYLALFRMLHFPYMPYIEWLCGTGNAAEVSWLSIAGLLLPLLFVPAVCMVGYRMGYAEFSVIERMTYRFKKEPSADEEI